MEDENFLKQAKSIFSSLKTDPNSVLFSEEQIDKWLLKKLNKFKYKKNILLLKLILLPDNNLGNEDKTPTRVDFVEKREIDRSTLYSFDEPLQLVHADVGNLEFLGKNATIPRYVLLVVDLYSSKAYVFEKTGTTENEIILWWSKK